MKLLFFDDFRLGVCTGDGVVDVSGHVADLPRAHPQDVISGVIENWPAYRGVLERAVQSGRRLPLASVAIRPPLPRPANIDCMAVNYLEETAPEAGPINGFQKSPHTVIGTGETMVLPDVPGTAFEAEAELGVVIGRWGSHVPASEAMDYVFGYTNLIDGSVRGLPPSTNSFYQMKSRATFCPIGPVIVTADAVPDPHDLSIRLWNNGRLMQDFSTSAMAHRIPRCIEFVSSLHPIGPGDVLATGTDHQGLHPLMDGDEVVLEVEGMGRLTVYVRDELKRTWKRQTRQERRLAGLSGLPPQLTGTYAREAETR